MEEENKGLHDSQQQPSLVPIWYWKETRNHLLSDNLPIWNKFEPHLNKLIEAAFASQQPSLITRDFTIDFGLLIMTIRSGEEVINFPVSRKTEEEEKPQIPETDTEEFKEGLKYSPSILGEWFKRNIPKMHSFTYTEKIKYALKAACSGILVYSKRRGYSKQTAKELVKMLSENSDSNDPEKLLLGSAKAYSGTPILYRACNEFFWRQDPTDIEVIGPFCYLLRELLWLTELKGLQDRNGIRKEKFRGTIYRGIKIPAPAIFEMFPLEDKILRLSGFCGGSVNKDIALKFMGREGLFIEIEVPMQFGLFCRNNSDFSPTDEEVILSPGSLIYVTERFTNENVHTIKGRLLPNKQSSYNLRTLKEYLERPDHKTHNLKLFYEYLETSKKTPRFLETMRNAFKKSKDQEQEVIWYWKANQDSWSVREEEIWKEYTKDQTKTIEKSYKSNQKEVQVGKYKVNFENMIQINSENPNLIRPVKRTDSRQERKRELLLYESIGKYLSPLIVIWQAEFLLEYGAPILKNIGVLTDLIALGIIEEGKAQQQESIGRALTAKLKEVASKSNFDIEAVFKCLARMYTEETFLYKSVNKALRENDITKADTLGAFCLLFNELITYFDTIKKYPYNGVVWRGTFIDESILQTYYPDKEPFIYWPAFSSTSKDKAAAERFMANVLFEIRLYDKGVDVEKLSAIQHEREVLIHSGSAFKVIEHKMIREGVHHIILSSQTF